MDLPSAWSPWREMTVQMAHYWAVRRLGTGPAECPKEL